AILCGESTPVIRSFRPSRSTAGYYLSASTTEYGGSMGSGGLSQRRVGFFVLFVTAALLAGAGTANAAGPALPTLWVPCAARSGPIPLAAPEAGRADLAPALPALTL